MKLFLAYVGGAIGKLALSGLLFGIFIVIFGMTPGQAMAEWLVSLPSWLTNPWFKLSLVIVGLVIIGVSLRFNVWSLRQKAIDQLAEDLSWAIHHLLNKSVSDKSEMSQWETDFKTWCQRVSTKLENRAFFTRADQLHFDRLGLVPSVNFVGSYDKRHDWLVNQLSLKFDRLRDVINWTQLRKR